MAQAPACLFSADEIRARVLELGVEIRDLFPGESITLLAILKGAVLFVADLARAVEGPVELAFVHAASYGDATVSSGNVRVGELEENAVQGKSVVIADTILDTGHTLSAVVRLVRAAGAAAVKTCVLLDNPARREVDVAADLVGFEVPNQFVVGYGLDYAERYRALPYVGVLDE